MSLTMMNPEDDHSAGEPIQDIFCAQQICIPPSFPYILRQYAKAAIRTQPNDLLKWSSAYFRCLSLNIPPPVKQRLEYPVPRDYFGLTPGWLRTLLTQLGGAEAAQNVTYRTLWERWTGACLQPGNLVQVLCLGGFDDPDAIPCVRFIALCAAHLTDNLTQTMVLVCELLTDEPEGGSAMVPVRHVIDTYQFLARIDASHPQTLKNRHFLDSLLGLLADEEQQLTMTAKALEAPTGAATSRSTISDLTTGDMDKKEDGDSLVVSCPSVQGDAFLPLENYLQMVQEEQEEDDDGAEEGLDDEGAGDGVKHPTMKGDGIEGDADDDDDELDAEPKTRMQPAAGDEAGDLDGQVDEGGAKQPADKPEEEDDTLDVMALAAGGGGANAFGAGVAGTDPSKINEENLARLRQIQQELIGESDDELEKFKQSILKDFPCTVTTSQQEAMAHFTTPIVPPDAAQVDVIAHLQMVEEAEEEGEDIDPDAKFDSIYVERIPGIGAIVNEKMVKTVCAYFEEVAKDQHGMVMPRNIRHYACPPLEHFENV